MARKTLTEEIPIEKLTEIPKTPKLLELYMEDRFVIVRNPDADVAAATMDKIKENNYYCISKTELKDCNRCMCEEFRNSTTPGPCACGLYIKKVRDEDEFLDLRRKALGENT